MSHHRMDPVPPAGGLARQVGAGLREVIVVFALALALSLVVKTWFAQAFFIPSGSMEDTLLVGDRVMVNKLAPRFSDLRRGDVVVFRDPGGWLPPQRASTQGKVLDAIHQGLVFVGLAAASEDHLIKRVIGLPGDHVVCCSANQRLMINGVEVDEASYLRPGETASTRPFDIRVPSGRLWVMGDHRSNSEDSRFHDPSGDGTMGSISVEDVTGRAVFRLWPLSRIGLLRSPSSVFAPVPAVESVAFP